MWFIGFYQLLYVFFHIPTFQQYCYGKESIISHKNVIKIFPLYSRVLLFAVFLQNLTPANNEGRLYT